MKLYFTYGLKTNSFDVLRREKAWKPFGLRINVLAE
jgi:hypothetical protein